MQKGKILKKSCFPSGSSQLVHLGQESSVEQVWVMVQAAAWGAELSTEGTTGASVSLSAGCPLPPSFPLAQFGNPGALPPSCYAGQRRRARRACAPTAGQLRSPGTAQPWLRAHFPPPSPCDTAIYFSISRKRETRRVFLTPRLNLQFYYIPVVTGQPNTLAIVVSLGLAAPGAAAGCQQLTVLLEEKQGGLQEFTSVNA